MKARDDYRFQRAFDYEEHVQSRLPRAAPLTEASFNSIYEPFTRPHISSLGKVDLLTNFAAERGDDVFGAVGRVVRNELASDVDLGRVAGLLWRRAGIRAQVGLPHYFLPADGKGFRYTGEDMIWPEVMDLMLRRMPPSDPRREIFVAIRDHHRELVKRPRGNREVRAQREATLRAEKARIEADLAALQAGFSD